MFDSVYELFCEQFALFLGWGCYFVLIVMELLSVCVCGGGVLCCIDHVWYSKEWVRCACDSSVHIHDNSIYLFVFVYVGSYLSFKSLKAGSQVFALLMLLICVIVHTMWSSKRLQLLCILPFGILCLSAIRMMFVKLYWQCVCWWGWWSERKRTLCLP